MDYRYYHYAVLSAKYAGCHIQPLWIYSQWRHETANFTSELCINCYNLGGLTQVSPNAYPQPDGDYYYMCFSSLDEFAEYFGRYLRLYKEDGLFDAYTIDDYILALHRGGYFGATLDEYMKGVKWYEKV